MLSATETAQSSMRLETFIFAADETGWRFAKALAAKTLAGIDVRFHFDAYGSATGGSTAGARSRKIYVKGGIVAWEAQQTDYPSRAPDLPNHEPRGCSRGARYS